MAVRATLRQASAPQTVAPKTNTNPNPVIDVPSTVEGVDETSAEQLADQLASGETTAEAVSNGEAGSPAPTPTTTAVAVRRDSAIGALSGGAMSGQFDESDAKFPQLKLVQGSGPMSKLFNSGSLVYGDEELFGPPDVKPGAVNPVLRFVPVQIHKQYRENVGEDDAKQGVMARIVNTLDEVYNLGGSTEWIDNQKPSWSPSARCLFLLEQPKDNEHPAFCIELDGKNYAPAIYFASGGAYAAVPKNIYNVLKSSLLIPVLDDKGEPVRNERGLALKRALLWKCFWTWQITKVPAGKFNPFRPLITPKFKEETGPEVRDYCETLLGTAGDQPVE